MRFLLCVGVVIAVGGARAAPQYRVSDLGQWNFGLMGSYANDGTIGAWDNSGGVLVRGNQSKYVSEVIPGYNPRNFVIAKSWDTFCGVDYGSGTAYAVHNGNATVMLPENGWNAYIGGINSSGNYVGARYQSGEFGLNQPFAVLNGVYQNLGVETGSVRRVARGINDSNEIAGNYYDGKTALDPRGEGARWNPLTRSWSPIPTTIFGVAMQAEKILNDGTVFGRTSSSLNAVWYARRTGGIVLPTDPTNTLVIEEGDMNSNSRIAGYIFKKPNLVWEGGQSWYLDQLSINPEVLPVGSEVRWNRPKINDLGQIVTLISWVDNGVTRQHLYRFDPVPEPATLVALGAGTLALLRRRGARRRS
jgi:hypothetical protein